MSRRAWIVSIIWIAVLLAFAPAIAQDAPAPAGDPLAGAEALKPLVVGTKEAAPFVLVDATSGEVSGLSIDIMREIAARMTPPRRLEFRVQKDLRSHLDAVRDGRVDLGIAATTVTRERERTLDFSSAFHRSGLGILVAAQEGNRLLGILLSPEVAQTALWLTAFVLACAVVVWLIERGSGAFDARPLRGVLQATWWVVVTMSTVGYGDFVPKRALGRAIGIVVIFSGILLFGVAIASFSSALTVAHLESQIRGVDDLDERRVAVVDGTIAADAMGRRRVKLLQVASVDAGLEAVRTGAADAFVHDRPILRYRIKDGDGSLVLVGSAFRELDYGIAFPYGSPLRKDVNLALLDFLEDPGSDHPVIVRRWLGDPVTP